MDSILILNTCARGVPNTSQGICSKPEFIRYYLYRILRRKAERLPLCYFLHNCSLYFTFQTNGSWLGIRSSLISGVRNCRVVYVNFKKVIYTKWLIPPSCETKSTSCSKSLSREKCLWKAAFLPEEFERMIRL